MKEIGNRSVARQIATAQVELERVMYVKCAVLSAALANGFPSTAFENLERLDRYERRARAAKRRAIIEANCIARQWGRDTL